MLKGSSLLPFAVCGVVLRASLSSSCNEFPLAGQCPHCLGSPGASDCDVCRMDFSGGKEQTDSPTCPKISWCASVTGGNVKKLKKSSRVRKWSEVKRQKILPTLWWLLGFIILYGSFTSFSMSKSIQTCIWQSFLCLHYWRIQRTTAELSVMSLHCLVNMCFQRAIWCIMHVFISCRCPFLPQMWQM